MLGVVSLANRSGHFDSEFLEFLAPLLSTVGQIINANRSERARRTAEQKLDLTGAQLTAFIAHTPAAVAMFDRNLNFLAFSRRWCTDFALASDAIAGKHLYSVLPDFPELWRNAYQRALQGEVQSEEADPYIGSGGTVRWFRWEARPWYDNANRSGSDTSGIILFCEDVTDSKRAADALHARDRLLSKLSARIPGMLFQLRTQIAEQKMSLLFVSEGARELYGKSPEDLSDDPRHLFRVIHPDDRVLAEAAIANAAQDCTLLTIEHRIVVADKPERWIHVEAALERLADASIIWHGYVQDITDRKRSEQRIAELAQAVRRVQGEMNLGGL
jgi:PAS domain S-box-containing protein